jgi:hypothetical protein
MKRFKILGLVFVLVLALTAVSAATALGADFEASEKSKLVAKVTAGAGGEQVFTTAAGKVICKVLKATKGESKVGLSKTQVVTIKYESCKAFGLAATISEAEYEFMAGKEKGTTGKGEGTVKVLKPITIKATSLCTVTVPVQEVGQITYTNLASGKEIELETAVTGIKSKGEGSACTYAEEAKGTYVGKSIVSLAGGGTLKWTKV